MELFSHVISNPLIDKQSMETIDIEEDESEDESPENVLVGDALGERPGKRRKVCKNILEKPDDSGEDGDAEMGRAKTIWENGNGRGILTQEPSKISTTEEYCTLTFSSLNSPLDQGIGGVVGGRGASGILLTLVLKRVCREIDSARLFLDQTIGPYFSEPHSNLFQTKSSSIFTEKEIGEECIVTVIPLQEIVKHVVATIRISSVVFSHLKGCRVDSGGRRKMITVKEVMRESDFCDGGLHDEFIEGCGVKRGRKKKKNRVDEGVHETSSRRTPKKKTKKRGGGQYLSNVIPTTKGVGSPGGEHHNYSGGTTERTKFIDYDCQTFCSQKILRQKTFPVMVSHGDVVFSAPLAPLILCIAEEMCMYEKIHPKPIPVNRNFPSKLDPFGYYSFPVLAVSNTLLRAVHKERRNSETTIPRETDLATKKHRDLFIESVPVCQPRHIPTVRNDSIPIPSSLRLEFPQAFTHPSERYYGPVVKHLREIVCGGDPLAYTLVETWLAEILFNPTVKYPVCPIFSGPQGIGKNILFDFLIQYVFGFDTSTMVMHLDQCTGKYNVVLRNKLLIVVNEEDLNKNDQSTLQVMKTLCTEVSQCIEKKYDDLKENVPIYVRMCILTNNPDPFRALSLGERRFVVIKTKKILPTHEYFESLKTLVLDPATAPTTALHFLGYLAELRSHRGHISMTCAAPDYPFFLQSPQVSPILLPETEDEIHSSSSDAAVSPIQEIAPTSPCRHCKIPHRLMHGGQKGYDPSILRKPVMTQFMIRKLVENMKPLHFFLYAFIIRKIPLASLLPANAWQDPDLPRLIPPHQDLDDLRFVGYNYFHVCYKLYMHYTPQNTNGGGKNGQRGDASFFHTAKNHYTSVLDSPGGTYRAVSGSIMSGRGSSSSLLLTPPSTSLCDAYSPVSLTPPSPSLIPSSPSPSPTRLIGHDYQVNHDELFQEINEESDTPPPSPNMHMSSSSSIFPEPLPLKRKRGRPKKNHISSHQSFGGPVSFLNSPGGTNLQEIQLISTLNDEIACFMGEYTKPIFKAKLRTSSSQSQQFLGVINDPGGGRGGYPPSQTLEITCVLHGIRKKVKIREGNGYPMEGNNRGWVDERFFNLSGTEASFRERYKECYTHLKVMFDDAFGDSIIIDTTQDLESGEEDEINLDSEGEGW